MERTHYNGELRLEHVGQEVSLIGWVAKKRNFGQLNFIDLRDRTGICQLLFNEQFSEQIKPVRNEYLLHVHGKVIERKDINPDLATGEIEIEVSSFEIVNTAKTTPLIIADETDALEDTRLEYRYLDLRRPVMQKKLMMRHQITRSLRDFLDHHGFIEIETPMLGKSTPEGARDYLVPSRVHPGSFYALPQSPQLYKQLLMISGFERYYQFARCFRDEDLRADRQTDHLREVSGRRPVIDLAALILRALIDGVLLGDISKLVTVLQIIDHFLGVSFGANRDHADLVFTIAVSLLLFFVELLDVSVFDRILLSEVRDQSVDQNAVACVVDRVTNFGTVSELLTIGFLQKHFFLDQLIANLHFQFRCALLTVLDDLTDDFFLLLSGDRLTVHCDGGGRRQRHRGGQGQRQTDD